VAEGVRESLRRLNEEGGRGGGEGRKIGGAKGEGGEGGGGVGL